MSRSPLPHPLSTPPFSATAATGAFLFLPADKISVFVFWTGISFLFWYVWWCYTCLLKFLIFTIIYTEIRFPHSLPHKVSSSFTAFFYISGIKNESWNFLSQMFLRYVFENCWTVNTTSCFLKINLSYRKCTFLVSF